MTPDPVAGLVRQADALDRAGRRWEAADLLERALAIEPDSPPVRFGLASVRASRPRGVDDLEQARRIARELLEVAPESPAYHYLTATAAGNLGLQSEADHHLAAAIATMPADDPNLIRARITEATIRLRRGDFAAFADVVRWADRYPDRRGTLALGSPAWDGSDLAGRTILVATTRDGDGDTIMFARYLPLLKSRGASVIVIGWNRQARLLAAMGAVDRVIVPGEPVPVEVARHDVHAYWLSLPALLGTTLDSIPARVPYLATDPAESARWRSALETIPGLRIGVAWQGDPSHSLDRLRSFPMAELAAIAAVPGVSLIALQKGPGAEAIASARFPIRDLGPDYHRGDWMTTAAVVANLDLAIAPDTAIAHLAGALGRPAWLVLARPAEWRWLDDRDESPWYPTARLFRQDRPGDWGPAFARMAESIARGEAIRTS